VTNRKSPEVRIHLGVRGITQAPDPILQTMRDTEVRSRKASRRVAPAAAILLLSTCAALIGSASAQDTAPSADATASAPRSAAMPDSDAPESSSSTTRKAARDKNARAAPDSPFAAFANSKNRGPVSIQSQSLTLDYKGNSVLFQGNVHAAQSDGQLSSNTLNVKYGKDFHEIQEMIAEGNVRLSQGLRWCAGDHGVMNQAAHTVILTGNPVCHDDKDQISGDKIIVHLDTGKSEVEGGVKAVIFPRDAKSRDNEVPAGNTN
jgi:lipopolysaccharide transport protein LptA